MLIKLPAHICPLAVSKVFEILCSSSSLYLIIYSDVFCITCVLNPEGKSSSKQITSLLILECYN